MSCPNFETQKNFNLYLWDYTRPSDEEIDNRIIEEEYRGITDKSEITESDRDNFCMSECELEYEITIDDFEINLKEVLHTFNRELNFHEVVLKDGYYCGLQFYVEETGYLRDYICTDEIDEVTNEDTKYYFDMCKSEFLRKYYSEINFINKKLLPKLASVMGFEEYYCMGIFSNGEAIYRKATHDVVQAVKEVA